MVLRGVLRFILDWAIKSGTLCCSAYGVGILLVLSPRDLGVNTSKLSFVHQVRRSGPAQWRIRCLECLPQDTLLGEINAFGYG
jgi:hypothetical protein